MSETKHTQMREPPGVYCSPLTDSFYFVRRFNKDGSASGQPVDVTPHVRGFIREAAEPLEKTNAALLEALRGLGGMPDGFCFCSRDRYVAKAYHEPECEQARAALAGEGEVLPPHPGDGSCVRCSRVPVDAEGICGTCRDTTPEKAREA